MSKTATLTLRVTEDVKRKLTQLAAETDRTPSAVAQRGLEAYVDHQLWVLEEIEIAREDFRQGRTQSHEEVMREAHDIVARRKDRAA